MAFRAIMTKLFPFQKIISCTTCHRVPPSEKDHTGQYHIQIHIKVISKMLKVNGENCGMNVLKTGTDYLF